MGRQDGTVSSYNVSDHTIPIHKNSKRLDSVQNKQVDQDTVNDYYKKFQLNLAKDYNAMNEVFKSNWSDIDALFLKHERKILSVEQEVKSIPTLINRKMEKVVAYTNAKSNEAILVSKEYTNSSLK